MMHGLCTELLQEKESKREMSKLERFEGQTNGKTSRTELGLFSLTGLNDSSGTT
jgi:hypothetical protein